MATITLKGTIVLTGANGDLGRSIAAKIASSYDLAANYHGIYAVRDSSSASALLAALKQNSTPRPHPHEVTGMNLERLDDVRKFATGINERVATGSLPPIRALVLNAGYLEHEEQTWVEGGLDTTWVVNYLSQWLLTLLLLKSMDRENGRVMVLGSHVHDPYDPFNYGTMGGYFDDDKWKTFLTDSVEPIAKGTWSSQQEDSSWQGGLRRYAASKMCIAMMIGELQRRLDEDPSLNGISILGVDPGWMATGIARRHPNYSFVRTVMPWVASLRSLLTPNGMFRTPDRSARDIVAVMFGEKPVGGMKPKGLYLKGAMQAEVSAEARDKDKRQMVWRSSVGYARLKDGDTMLVNWK
ncbi:NAD(P)-binding protein [Annulohypoxylon bovei var. microspora]|nr:NAD(P)-binding protein [Annulohypoxylon bovei var. microspora]